MPESGAISHISFLNLPKEKEEAALTHIELRSISIVSIDITTSIKLRLLLIGELGQETRDKFLQILRIVAVDEGRVGKPAFVEIPCSLISYGVFR